MTGTYSPDDDKLRLYSLRRLDEETYQRVRAAGFRWAPKQELFVAPSWSPAREDLLLELCGEIDDEDASMEERSADRADRFENYRDKRRTEAGGHADTFEQGPGAFGHQNQQRAQRQAARHDRHRTRALCQWSKAEYWQERTARVIGHALHKAKATVRRSRILRLEADQRRCDGSGRWAQHYELRLAYERAMLENEGGTVAEVEIVPGGFFGAHQVWKVNKSSTTGRVVSVLIRGKWGYVTIGGQRCYVDHANADGLAKLNIERLPADAYTPPTEDERAAFAETQAEHKAQTKASQPKKPSLINPTDACGLRLQELWNSQCKGNPSDAVRMTQAQYSARSKGSYSPCDTVEMTASGKEPRRKWGQCVDMSPVMFKVRRMSGPGFNSAYRVVVITDKPQKALPWACNGGSSGAVTHAREAHAAPCRDSSGDHRIHGEPWQSLR